MNGFENQVLCTIWPEQPLWLSSCTGFRNKIYHMRTLLRPLLVLCASATLIIASCSNAKSNPEEEAAISAMDSTAQAVEDSTELLKEQTRKVEESLEKLNKEFETSTDTKTN